MNEALRIQLAPNCSLRPEAAAKFFAGVCLVSFSIAGTFALVGLWPILPFAGLEMFALGWALRASLRRRYDSQIIEICEDRVLIRTREGVHREQAVFPRHWAQVTLRAADSPLHPSRLTIRSHGRSYEVGRFLTEEERQALARRLIRWIGRINESPPLEGALEPECVRPER